MRQLRQAPIPGTPPGQPDAAIAERMAAAERAVVAAEIGVDRLEEQLALATASVAALRSAARHAGIRVSNSSTDLPLTTKR